MAVSVEQMVVSLKAPRHHCGPAMITSTQVMRFCARLTCAGVCWYWLARRRGRSTEEGNA
jgi:uncharacterized membrane protein AbrB (regulator of aidB expression)